MLDNRVPSRSQNYALWRIAGGYGGLAILCISIYVALQSGEATVAQALTHRGIQILAVPVMFAAFAVASAIQFRAQLGRGLQFAGLIPAAALVALIAWLWGGA